MLIAIAAVKNMATLHMSIYTCFGFIIAWSLPGGRTLAKVIYVDGLIYDFKLSLPFRGCELSRQTIPLAAGKLHQLFFQDIARPVKRSA